MYYAPMIRVFCHTPCPDYVMHCILILQSYTSWVISTIPSLPHPRPCGRPSSQYLTSRYGIILNLFSTHPPHCGTVTLPSQYPLPKIQLSFLPSHNLHCCLSLVILCLPLSRVLRTIRAYRWFMNNGWPNPSG